MRETTKWTWHVISGIVVLVFLGLHMLIMHMDDLLGIFNPMPGGAVSWENVTFRGQLLFFDVTYIVLLAAALYHGFYGLRVILFELIPRRSVQIFITSVLWLSGIALFVLGTYTVIATQGLSVGSI